MNHVNGLGIHYHNSVSGVTSPGKEGKYKPRISIKTEVLTEKYTIKSDIGRGKFAVVRKCIHNESGEEVAAKFIKKRRRGKTCREEIMREVVMLERALEHPRLVDLKEVYETQSELILVTEYCSGGELYNECVIEESFKEGDVVRMMKQILEGLTYLHERNIVHLDLKPQNILFTKPFPEGDIKLCDLGFACLVNTGEDIRDIIGTPDYVAPEVLSYEPLGLYTDMWSLGVLTYVMLTAHSPFAGNTQQETFLNISQVNLDFPESLFSNISSVAKDFIVQLLQKDPEDRLTAMQCFEHPWMSSTLNATTIKLLKVPVEEEITDSGRNSDKISSSTNVNVCDTDSKSSKDTCDKDIEILSNQNSDDKNISFIPNQNYEDKDEDLMSNQDECDKNTSMMSIVSNQTTDDRDEELMSNQDECDKCLSVSSNQDEDLMSNQDACNKDEDLTSNQDMSDKDLMPNQYILEKDVEIISSSHIICQDGKTLEREECSISETTVFSKSSVQIMVSNTPSKNSVDLPQKLTDSFKENEEVLDVNNSSNENVYNEMGKTHFVNDYSGKVYSSHLDIVPSKILRLNPECENFLLHSHKDVLEKERQIICTQKGCSNMEMDTADDFNSNRPNSTSENV